MWCCWNIAAPGQPGGLGAPAGSCQRGSRGLFRVPLISQVLAGGRIPGPKRCCNLPGISWELLSAEGTSAGDGVTKSPWQPNSELL